MAKFFIVSPQADLLRAYLFGRKPENTWVFYPCDPGTYSGMQEVKKWVEDHSPDYVLIHLIYLDKEDLAAEQQLSRFFKERNLPAQFLLPDSMTMSDEEAAKLSRELCIEEFLGLHVTNPELSQRIESFAEFGNHYYKVAASDLTM